MTNTIQNKIEEAIRATYPEDIFGTVPEEKRAKDGVAAQLLRDMAHSLASIAYQAIEPELSSIATLAQEEERKEMVEKLEERQRIKAQMVYKSYEDITYNSGYLKAVSDILSTISNTTL